MPFGKALRKLAKLPGTKRPPTSKELWTAKSLWLTKKPNFGIAVASLLRSNESSRRTKRPPTMEGALVDGQLRLFSDTMTPGSHSAQLAKLRTAIPTAHSAWIGFLDAC